MADKSMSYNIMISNIVNEVVNNILIPIRINLYKFRSKRIKRKEKYRI